jgi:hypothetical protein
MMLKLVCDEPVAAGQGRGGRPPEWISTGEAAAMLEVSPQTVRRWAKDRWLTSRCISPDRRRVQVLALEVEELRDMMVTPAFDVAWRTDG